MRAALEESIAGRGGCFLISGEPGIGKTRLADELAADAASRGIRVAWGRCWEGGGAPAYWPWVEIVRSFVLEPGRARQQQPAVPPEIGQLIPELAAETTQQRSSSDPEQGRFRLFDAVATLVKQVARSTPLVLILDDLHEADRGSLELLKFVARGLTDSRVVIVGTYRDAEVRRSSYLAESISEIVRHGHPMPLAGLAENEVAQMIEYCAERAPSSTFASELHRVTAGNPLFVDGVIRVLVAERKLGTAEHLDLSGFKLPEGVRGAIRKRLALLSAEARSALAVAAVIGQEFGVVLLERVNKERVGTLAELMREAVEIGIVAAPSREIWRFTHPLIREALYKDSTDADRARLHRAIAEALEEMHAANLTPHLAALANHFREAGIIEKAIDYLVRAGRAAYALFAYEEVVHHWEAAAALQKDRSEKAMERARLLEDLGAPALLGLEKRGVGYLEQSLKLYEGLGQVEAAARVHVKIGYSLTNVNDPVLRGFPLALSHYRTAETLLADGQNFRLLSRLYSGLSTVALELMQNDQGLEASRRAMEIGEQSGDELLWVRGALIHADSLYYRGDLAKAFHLLNRAWQKADELNSTSAAAMAAAGICFCHAYLWNPQEGEEWVRRELSKSRLKHAPSLRRHLFHNLAHACVFAGKLNETRRLLAQTPCLLVEAIVAFYAGDWSRAESTLLKDLEEQGRRPGRPQQEAFATLWLGRLHRARSEHSKAENLLHRALAIIQVQRPYLEVDIRSELTVLYVDSARLNEAQSQLARLREIINRGENWLGLAGHVARAEASVAVAEGRYQEAQGHFEAAVGISRRCQVPWDEAEALQRWGRALLAVGEHQHAVKKFDAAIEIYKHHDAGRCWIDRVEEARIEPPATAAPLVEQRPSDEECLFRREGDFWTVAYRGVTCRLRDMKGFGYIAHLIAHPGDRIHVLDLFAQVRGSRAATAPSADLRAEDLEVVSDMCDASEVLDSRARAEYRRRLSELHAELEEAERNNDPGSAERTRNELSSLTDGLRSALGLGGRSRRFTAETERARGTVSKSIRVSLERIQRNHQELGAHLSTCIRTGYFCAYMPDPGRQPSWRI